MVAPRRGAASTPRRGRARLAIAALALAALALAAAAAAALAARRSAPPPPLVVATGANAAFFPQLANLLGSVQHWCPECRLEVFDLGLELEQRAALRRICNVALRWPGGPPARLGALASKPKKYAWKPAALLEAVDAGGAALWLDAGSTVTAPLGGVADALRRDGYLLVHGQDDDMVPWTHPRTFAWLGYNSEAAVERAFRGRPSFSGNTVGFSRGSRAYWKILRPWAACALEEGCVAPAGATLADHRFDQSALSVIAHGARPRPRARTEQVLAAEREEACFVAAPRPVWSSRGEEGCYVAALRNCSGGGAER
jgi:hypothetical protein